jgi:hypothetical protein
LLIATTGGRFVHAHAQLGRVVLTPLPPPWPVVRQWRIGGGPAASIQSPVQ